MYTDLSGTWHRSLSTGILSMHTAITWMRISFEYLLSARHSDELWEDFGGAVNIDSASAKHID